MPPPLPQGPSGSAGSLSESDVAQSTSAEQILSLKKAKNLDDHVPSLKRKRKGGFKSSQITLLYFKLNQKRRSKRESKESSETDIKV